MSNTQIDEPQDTDSCKADRSKLPPATLTAWTGYLLAHASQRFQEHFDQLLEPFHIHVRQFRVLALLGETEPLAQVVIGERLSIDRNTVVLLLDDLESVEYVVRRRDPSDRRAHCVSLTETGKTVLAEGLALAQVTNDTILGSLNVDERHQLHRLLRRLFDSSHAVTNSDAENAGDKSEK